VATLFADPEIGFPSVTEYLSRLPAGHASHPQCQVRAALLRRALEERPLELRHVAALPAPVGRIVTCPPLDGEWLSDVWLACVVMAIHDAYGMDEPTYLAWLRALNVRMFDGPYRTFMKLASAEQLIQRAPERWSFFHRGSSLEIVDVAPGRCTLHLTFPPYLFHGLALRQFAAVFEAALQMADPDARVEAAGGNEVRGVFVGTWKA
jgi:hypothetical protein